MAEKTDPKIVKRVFALREEYKKAPDWHEIAEAINKEFGAHYNHKSMANVYNRFAKGVTAPDKKEPHTADPEGLAFIERVSKKIPKNPSVEEWLRAFLDAQGFRAQVSDRELQCEATIKTDGPIAVSWLGDWHIGSPHTDYHRLYRDVDFIKKTKGLYCCISGDRADMFMPGFKDATAVMGQIMPPDIQLDAVDALVNSVKDKIVAAIGGNHDTMARRKTGVDAERQVRKKWPFSYMPHGGLLTLNVGKQQYKILWKHHYRFNSSLNQFNSHHRMLELLDPSVDVVVTEHEHNPGIESVERGTGAARRTVISVRTGAYKIDDGYSLDYYKEGCIGPQTIVFYPDRKKCMAIHGSDSLTDAATYLRGINGKV